MYSSTQLRSNMQSIFISSAFLHFFLSNPLFVIVSTDSKGGAKRNYLKKKDHDRQSHQSGH
jgi:hypothetical protein